jgi:Mg2+ and Co2+ transporter CorA
VQTTGFEIDDKGRFQKADTDACLERWRAGGGPFWIDAQDADPQEQDKLLSDLGIEPEVASNFLQSGHASRVVPLANVVFFEFPLHVAGEPPQVKSIAVVCLERLVVTLCTDPVPQTLWAGENMVAQLPVQDPSVSAIVCTLLVAQSIQIRRASLGLRNRVFRLAEDMDRDPEGVKIADVLDLKHEVTNLDAIVDERLAIMENIGHIRKEVLDLVRLADEFRLATGNTESTARRVDRLGRRVTDLQIRYDLNQQDKTNRKLGRLTVISAIFLPLTLLAGIYGMNFDVMPELHFRYGYFLALGSMILIGAALYWWFRSRGWME